MNSQRRTLLPTPNVYNDEQEESHMSLSGLGWQLRRSVLNRPLSIRTIFGPDDAHNEGVFRINIYLLRLMFILMVLVLGRTAWAYVLTHDGPWDPDEAVAWSVFASFSVLAVLGIVRPLKMLPLVLLEIAYKVLWLILVAYPLWSTNQLAGSLAEERTYSFLWVALAIIATPWKYVFNHYVRGKVGVAGRQS